MFVSVSEDHKYTHVHRLNHQLFLNHQQNIAKKILKNYVTVAEDIME